MLSREHNFCLLICDARTLQIAVPFVANIFNADKPAATNPCNSKDEVTDLRHLISTEPAFHTAQP